MSKMGSVLSTRAWYCRLRERNGKRVASSWMLEIGGANRDRTDDLKLAKLALSQLSYGPKPIGGPRRI